MVPAESSAGVITAGLDAYRSQRGLHWVGLGEARNALFRCVVHNQARAVAGVGTLVFLEEVYFERVELFFRAGFEFIEFLPESTFSTPTVFLVHPRAVS